MRRGVEVSVEGKGMFKGVYGGVGRDEVLIVGVVLFKRVWDTLNEVNFLKRG